MKTRPVQTRSMARWFLLIMAVWAALAWPAGVIAQSFHATVLSIGDGDTIRVQQGGKRITIRLACIDAPELAQAPDGVNARSYLQSRLQLGSSVTLRPQTVDRFGRTVAEVFSGVNLNLALVEDGKAFAYRRYLFGCNAKAYLDAQSRASRRRRTSGRAGSSTESIPGGRRYRCGEIGSFARAQELLRKGHTYLDRNGDGVACESLR